MLPFGGFGGEERRERGLVLEAVAAVRVRALVCACGGFRMSATSWEMRFATAGVVPRGANNPMKPDGAAEAGHATFRDGRQFRSHRKSFAVDMPSAIARPDWMCG